MLRFLSLFVLPLFVSGVLGGVGCSAPDLSGPGTPDPAQLVWTMALSAHAITMSTAAPYDTLQLMAVPRIVSGAPLTNAPNVTFTTSDSSLRVSATGLLTARSVQNGVLVIATVVDQGIRISDTAVVNVTAETHPPTFQHFLLQLPPGDSLKVVPNLPFERMYFANGGPGKNLLIGAQDLVGTRIPNSLVQIRTSDILQSSLSCQFSASECIGSGSRVRTGDDTAFFAINQNMGRVGTSITVYGEATVYGVTRQDSLTFLVIPQVFFINTITKSTPLGSQTPVFTRLPLSPQVIGVGGYVWWANKADSTDSLDVVFDDPTAASPDSVGFFSDSTGGNIAPFPGSNNTFDFGFMKSRRFLRAGTFPWHSTRLGVSGMVIVQ